MSGRALFVLILVSTGLFVPCRVLHGQSQPREDASADIITWKDKDLPGAELVADDAALRRCFEAWRGFASTNGYRLLLTEDRRILLVVCDIHARLKSGKERSEVKKFLELCDATNSFCDSFLAPEKSALPLVMLCTRHADYPKALARLGELHPKIKDWTTRAGGTAAGFVLSDPLIGAWLDDPPGVTEWHPFNELVHRLAQLRIRRQAPSLPDWLLLGLAWHVEDGVRRSIYCFPHRRGFVSAASHTDWGLWLANAFKKSTRKRQDKPVTLGFSEFVDWRPGRDAGFESGKAYLCFGVARYLVLTRPEALQDLSRRLSAATEKGRKVVLPDKTWRLDPEFELPPATQVEMLGGIEKNLLEKVTVWFQKKKATERIRGKLRKR